MVLKKDDVDSSKKIKSLEKKIENLRCENEEIRMKHQNMINQLAHDLRTPLTPIISFLQILEMDLKTEKLREQAEVAYKNAKYLNDLLKNILEISKDNFKMSLVLESTDIMELVKGVIDSHKPIFAKKQIKIVPKLDRVPKINVDRIKLREAIDNILKNAYSYSYNGKKVHVSVSRGSDEVVISIKDQGRGIKEENIERIFDEFYRCDYARSKPHLGLGLSIAKKIIDKHNGKIEVESKGEDKGTTFIIHMPLKKK